MDFSRFFHEGRTTREITKVARVYKYEEKCQNFFKLIKNKKSIIRTGKGKLVGKNVFNFSDISYQSGDNQNKKYCFEKK